MTIFKDQQGNMWRGELDGMGSSGTFIADTEEIVSVEPVGRIHSVREAHKQWSEAGYELVTLSEYRRRYKICKKCGYLVLGQCELCTCFMRLKCLLAGMTCKANKW